MVQEGAQADRAPDKASRVPEGLWVKCPECDTIIYKRDLDKNLSVCTKCAHHFRLSGARAAADVVRRRALGGA